MRFDSCIAKSIPPTIVIFVFTDRMTGWQILENSGDKWKVEGVMVPHPNETVQKNFVTSYG